MVCRYPHLHIDMDSDEFYHKNFRHNEATPGRVTQIRNQVSYLRNVINHLRNAYNGQDVEWTEEGEEILLFDLLLMIFLL